MTRIRVAVAALVTVLSVASELPAQQWARDMFQHTSHDFGTVATGAKVEYRFTFENIYLETAHVALARVSCNCTTPEYPKQDLKTWEKGEIIAKVDTKSYHGQRDVTITVVFDKPFRAEVQLQIHCYIRTDVVIQPEVVQFGSVCQGSGGERKVVVKYAGRNDWAIKSFECANPHLSAKAAEVSRGNGLVTYDLTVNLSPQAPAGYIRDELNLVTNDPNPRAVRVPVPVEGVVRPGVTLSPALLYLGPVEAGKSVNGQLMVRGDAPFRILRAESNDPRFQCAAPATVATMHWVHVVFQAGTTPGEAVGKIKVTTDARAEPLESDVSAKINAAVAAEKPSVPLAPTVLPSSAPAGEIKPDGGR